MKLAGSVLLLLSAGGLCLLRRREAMLPLRLGRALLEDLAALAYQIRVCRRPMPVLLEEYLTEGLGAEWLWQPLLAQLQLADKNGTTLSRCWQSAVQGLPPALKRLLAPLGTALGMDGEQLSVAVEETREELTRFLREETSRQASQGRITAALCLSGALLVILVLL